MGGRFRANRVAAARSTQAARSSLAESSAKFSPPFLVQRQDSPLGCKEGSTIVWQPVERTSIMTLPLVSFHFSLAIPGARKNQCDCGELVLPLVTVEGRKYSTSSRACGTSRSTSTTPPEGSPKSIPTFCGSSLKYLPTSSSPMCRFCQSRLTHFLSPYTTGTTASPLAM